MCLCGAIHSRFYAQWLAVQTTALAAAPLTAWNVSNMALDPKSKERLEALGRRLPQPLATPEKTEATPIRKLHPVETEQNPEELFRQLMQVSPDGNVPDHLLARLKSMEAKKSETTKIKQKNNQIIEKDTLYTEFQQLLLEQDEV
jgi:hypothetical protein